ncbi:unnamed protein product [Chrysoparadoxa australica]
MGTQLSVEAASDFIKSDKANNTFDLSPPKGKLSWSEVGSLGGIPCLLFQPLGASRYVTKLFGNIAESCGLRLIAIDYPGDGLSTPQQGRTLEHWCEDMKEFIEMERLGDEIVVMGGSAGGLHALALAAAEPTLVKACVVLAPWVPPSHPTSAWFAKLGGWAPGCILRPITFTVPKFTSMMMKKLTPKKLHKAYKLDERLTVSDGEVQLLQAVEVEAHRQGGAGFHETFCLCCEKNGPLSPMIMTQAVMCPTLFFCGTKDTMVRPKACRKWAESIGAEFRGVEGFNHLTIQLKVPEALRWLAQARQRHANSAPEPLSPIRVDLGQVAPAQQSIGNTV